MKGDVVRGVAAQPSEDATRDTRDPAPRMQSFGVRRGIRGNRPRSWGLVTVAALCVLGTGLAVAAWGLHAGEKASVLVIASPVARGQVIARDDLATRSVAGVPGAVPTSEMNDVVNQTAVVDLVEGQILTSRMFAERAVPAAGEATVGLALDPARVPGAGLDPGDVVDVIAVPGGDAAPRDPDALDTPEVLAEGVDVFSVEGVATAGGQVLVTIVVEASDAARISAYSTQNRVAVVETSLAGATTTGE